MNYLLIFLLGGTTVLGINLLSNHVNPKYAAILGAFPIGILSSIYITKLNILDHYLKNYAVMSIILFITAVTYDMILKRSMNRNNGLIAAIFIWLLLTILKLTFLKDL